jgi:predicted transcriptional regulator YdeE
VAEFSGFTARIFQHEVDHLNGIRFPDRTGSEGKLHWVEDSEYSEYKKNYEAWNCKYPWDLWLSMKSGEPYSVPVKEQSEEALASLYTFEQQSEKFFIGLELRTNNEECSSAMPAHKDRFFNENISAKIPNKLNSNILALYTDYEGDYTKPYSWILGIEVSSLDEVPAGLVGKVIPESKYAVFKTQGEFPQGLIAAWQAVWKSNLPRSYTSDFELYRSDFNAEENSEVKVYIAIEDKEQ